MTRTERPWNLKVTERQRSDVETRRHLLGRQLSRRSKGPRFRDEEHDSRYGASASRNKSVRPEASAPELQPEPRDASASAGPDSPVKGNQDRRDKSPRTKRQRFNRRLLRACEDSVRSPRRLPISKAERTAAASWRAATQGGQPPREFMEMVHAPETMDVFETNEKNRTEKPRKPASQDAGRQGIQVTSRDNQVTLQKQKPKEATCTLRWKHQNVATDSTGGSKP